MCGGVCVVQWLVVQWSSGLSAWWCVVVRWSERVPRDRLGIGVCSQRAQCFS